MAISQKPFTALVEDTMIEVRENSSESSVENKYKRRVNDVYVRLIPSKYDFDFLRASSSLTIAAAYSTGTVTIDISVSTTAIVGVSTVWTTTMTGYKMKINGNDEIYTFTRTGATTGTISPAYTGSSDATTVTYILFQDTYSMASDFESDRLVIPPGFYYDYAGSKVQLNPQFSKDWYKTWTTNSNNLPTNYRFFGRDSSNLYWQVQFTPPITSAKKISYEYIPALVEMTEYTTGTCATTAGSTTVEGTGTDFVNNVSAGDAFRMDSTSNDWYLVASVTDADTLVLTSAYPSAKTTAAYTISEVPKYPVALQLAIFYGACFLSAQDQDNQVGIKTYFTLAENVVNEYQKLTNRSKYGRQKMKVRDLYRK
jgi:hypothetical protein